ncbi:MAG: glycoside hydrolase family 15 protein [Elusimicrobiota bacterium]|jgi:hypothetical protein|nr:glycoside hydrolase family 15 protein [Elusimicrobiota bacterium]
MNKSLNFVFGAGLAFLVFSLFSIFRKKEEINTLEDFAHSVGKIEMGISNKFEGGNNIPPYEVFVHNPKINSLLKNEYDLADILTLDRAALPARKIDIVSRPWGDFIQAASFSADMGKSTNYDAVWVRDSIWCYLALKSEEIAGLDRDSGIKESRNDASAAKKILITLLDYLSSQIDRMQAVIKNPKILDLPDGQMNAVHIRFDSNSPIFADVKENGEPQIWNHKQNDALGLLLDSAISAVKDGSISLDEIVENARLDALVCLIAYFDSSKFYAMEDSGAWEEEARLNASSIGLVTSALENLSNAIEQNKEFALIFNAKTTQLKLKKSVNAANIKVLIDSGYRVVKKQIAQGGESPSYKKTYSKYRLADAALLSLIYPSNLSRLTTQEKRKILDIVSVLAGDYGIKRYENDNYQSANFWFNDIRTDTAQESMDMRKKTFIEGSEAQWFFDSWFCLCSIIMYRRTKDRDLLTQSFKYTNRALAQITGDNVLGANGKKVASFALPESYNTLIYSCRYCKKWFAPSPITPLNWAKASMTLMFKEWIVFLSKESKAKQKKSFY